MFTLKPITKFHVNGIIWKNLNNKLRISGILFWHFTKGGYAGGSNAKNYRIVGGGCTQDRIVVGRAIPWNPISSVIGWAHVSLATTNNLWRSKGRQHAQKRCAYGSLCFFT